MPVANCTDAFFFVVVVVLISLLWCFFVGYFNKKKVVSESENGPESDVMDTTLY